MAAQDTRLEQVESRVYHIDSEVSGLKSSLHSQGKQLDAQGTQLNRIEQAILNKPPLLNFGVLFSIIGMVGTLLYGITSYVGLQMGYLAEDVNRNSEIVSGLQEFQREAHYEVGRFGTKIDNLEQDSKHFDEMRHALEDRVNKLESQSSAAKVSRKAMGDYMQDLDRYGSRRWIETEK